MDVRVSLVKVSMKTKQCMPHCPVHCLADSDHFFPLLGIVSRTQPTYKNKLQSSNPTHMTQAIYTDTMRLFALEAYPGY